MLLALFLVAGMLNTLANEVNYNVQANKPDFDVRVRRDLDGADNIAPPIELHHENEPNTGDTAKQTEVMANRVKRSDDQPDDRVNGVTYGQKSRKRNFLTSLVGSLNIFDKSRTVARTNPSEPNYQSNWNNQNQNTLLNGYDTQNANSYPNNYNGVSGQRNGNVYNGYPYNGNSQNGNAYNGYPYNSNSQSGNVYNGYPNNGNGLTYPYNGNDQNTNGYPYNGNSQAGDVYNGYPNNDNGQSLNGYPYNDNSQTGDVYNGYPYNGNKGPLHLHNGFGYGPVNPAVNTESSRDQLTVSPISGNSRSNGNMATTTAKMDIAEGCVLCATIGCAKHQRRVGFKCVDDYDY